MKTADDIYKEDFENRHFGDNQAIKKGVILSMMEKYADQFRKSESFHPCDDCSTEFDCVATKGCIIQARSAEGSRGF